MSSPPTGSSTPPTRKIVLAKIEALADGHATGIESTEQHVEGHVLGYLEVQQEGAEGGTIYLQPDEIEIDGEHLLLAQGEEGGEIIVVVSTDQETGLSTISKCDGTTEIVYAQDSETLVEVPVLSEKNELQNETDILEISHKDAIGIEDTENNLIEASDSVVEVVNSLETISENQILEKEVVEGKTYYHVVTNEDGQCTIDSVHVDENGIVCHVVEDVEKQHVLDVVESQVDYATTNETEDGTVYNIVEETTIIADETQVSQVVADNEVVLTEETTELHENTTTVNPESDIVIDITGYEHDDGSGVSEVETVIERVDVETDSPPLSADVSENLPQHEETKESEQITSQDTFLNENLGSVLANENTETESVRKEEKDDVGSSFVDEVKEDTVESEVVNGAVSEVMDLGSNSTTLEATLVETNRPVKEVDDNWNSEVHDLVENMVANQTDEIHSLNEDNNSKSESVDISSNNIEIEDSTVKRSESVCVLDDVQNSSLSTENAVSLESKSDQVTESTEILENSLRDVDLELASDSQWSENASSNMIDEVSAEGRLIEKNGRTEDSKDNSENQVSVESVKDEYMFCEENFDEGQRFRKDKLTYQNRKLKVVDTSKESTAFSDISASSTVENIFSNDDIGNESEIKKASFEKKSLKQKSSNLCKEGDASAIDSKNIKDTLHDSGVDVNSVLSSENCLVNAKDSSTIEKSAVNSDKEVPSSAELLSKSTSEESSKPNAASSETADISDTGKISDDISKTGTETKDHERRKSARQQARKDSKTPTKSESSSVSIQESTKKTTSLTDTSIVSDGSKAERKPATMVFKASPKMAKVRGASSAIKSKALDFDLLLTNKDKKETESLKSKANGISQISSARISGGKKKQENSSKRKPDIKDSSDPPSKRTRQTPNKKVTFSKSEIKSQDEIFDDLLHCKNELLANSTPTKKTFTPLMSSLGFSVTGTGGKKRKGSSTEESSPKKIKLSDKARKKDGRTVNSKSSTISKGGQDGQNQQTESNSEQKTDSCMFYIRYQSPTKTPEKEKSPPSMFNCKECHFKTTRIENIIHHYKECSLVLFQWDTQGQGMGEKVPTRFTLEKESAVMTTPIKSVPKRFYNKSETPKKSPIKKLKSPKVTQKVAVHSGEGDAAVSDTKESLDNLSDIFESDTDSDDLPPAFGTPSKSDLSFKEEDIVWVDWKNQHWPALVKKIYPKTKKVSILFIDTPMPEKGMRVSMKKITTFDNAARNKQYMSESRTKASGDQQIKAVQKAEDYLRKLCLGLKMTTALDFFSRPEGYISDLESSGEMDTSNSLLDHPLLGTHESHLAVAQMPTDNGHSDEAEEGLPSPSSAAMEEEMHKTKEMRKQRNMKFLNCIKEGKVEDHLLELYQGTIANERHRKFHSAVASERNQLKHVTWFGPIDDEEQQEEIIDYCLSLFKTHFVKKESFDLMAYVFEVWTPEAIIKAISRVLLINLAEAGDIFEKGTDWNFDNHDILKPAGKEPVEPLPP